MRNILRVCAMSVALALTVSAGVNSQIDNIEARFEGPVVVPDTINGLDGIIPAGATVNIVFSMQTAQNWKMFTLPFNIYSPDASIDSIVVIDGPTTLQSWVEQLPPVLAIETPAFFNGVLPEEFGIATALLSREDTIFIPDLTDFITLTIKLPDSQSGVVCLDSGLIPPNFQWLADGATGNSPQWGASVGGYADGGLCFTVVSGLNCCQIAGDANHDGSLNIADATFLIAYIFAGGDSPMCCAEGDANGDGMINISDVLYHIAVNFLGGPLPMCGPADLLSCGR